MKASHGIHSCFFILALAVLLLNGACQTSQDVPVPDDEQAREWTPFIKNSYPDWQPPLEMPAGNPDYCIEAFDNGHRKSSFEPPQGTGLKFRLKPLTSEELSRENLEQDGLQETDVAYEEEGVTSENQFVQKESYPAQDSAKPPAE